MSEHVNYSLSRQRGYGAYHGGLLLFALLAVSCQGAEVKGARYATLNGLVHDSLGQPLDKITVYIQGDTTRSDEEGKFTFTDLQADNPLRIKLHGHEGTGSYQVELNDTADTTRLQYPAVTKIILLHDNDLHFNYNYREDFEAYIRNVRDEYENVWLLNGGDTFVRHAHRWQEEGDTSYYVQRSRRMIQTMNEVGYDVSVPGNHEIDYVGIHSGLSLAESVFPFIGANIHVATTKLPQLLPFVTFETVNGLSLAVLGLTTVNFDKPGVTARDPAETAKIFRNLGEEHDVFVALTHIGLSADEKVAMAVPELDVIVGGHSHTFLEEAIMVNGVLIAQAGGPPPQHQVDPDWPKYLGIVRLVLENGNIVSKSGYVETFR